MPYQIQVSRFSFIQFAESDVIESCNWPGHDMCLPVYDVNDAWFQFTIIGDTAAEIDDLCTPENGIAIGLVRNCADEYLIEFTQRPTRYRIGETTLVYIWSHGLPGFDQVLAVGDCFRFKIELTPQAWCSNCLQRIGNDCHTSVIEFSNNDNAFGYFYCAGGDDGTDGGGAADCEPIELQFVNQATMTIPWTAYLNDRFGPLPSIEVWVYDPVTNELIKPGIVAKLDTYPPTQVFIDFGGPSSGIVKLM